jgi:hypothetical protein
VPPNSRAGGFHLGLIPEVDGHGAASGSCLPQANGRCTPRRRPRLLAPDRGRFRRRGVRRARRGPEETDGDHRSRPARPRAIRESGRTKTRTASPKSAASELGSRAGRPTFRRVIVRGPGPSCDRFATELRPSAPSRRTPGRVLRPNCDRRPLLSDRVCGAIGDPIRRRGWSSPRPRRDVAGGAPPVRERALPPRPNRTDGGARPRRAGPRRAAVRHSDRSHRAGESRCPRSGRLIARRRPPAVRPCLTADPVQTRGGS